MKMIILAALVMFSSLHVLAADDSAVTQKVRDAFNKTFLGAQEVSWSKTSDSYAVNFKQNEIASRIIYDEQGTIIKTYRYYHEENLPLLLLSRVKAKYTTKKIFGVVEVATDEGIYYYITLEGEKDWMEIKADAYCSMTVEKKFKKA